MAERIQKRLSYRRCRFSSKGYQLQERLESALKATSKAKERLEPLSSHESTAKRLINFFDAGPALCGELIVFEPGRSREIVGSDDSAEFLPLSAMPPPHGKDGKRQDYVDSVLYFCVIENHLAICESRGLRSSGLERHLDWLLRTQTDAIDKKTFFSLDQEFSKSTLTRVAKAGVKAIKLRRPLFDDFESQAQKTASNHLSVRPKGVGLDALKTFLGSSANALNSMRLDNILDTTSLDVSVEIRVRGRNNVEGVKVATSMLNLTGLDPASAHADGPELELELADKTRVKGGDLMPYHIASVPSKDKIPNRVELWSEMRNWLSDLID